MAGARQGCICIWLSCQLSYPNSVLTNRLTHICWNNHVPRIHGRLYRYEVDLTHGSTLAVYCLGRLLYHIPPSFTPQPSVAVPLDIQGSSQLARQGEVCKSASQLPILCKGSRYSLCNQAAFVLYTLLQSTWLVCSLVTGGTSVPLAVTAIVRSLSLVASLGLLWLSTWAHWRSPRPSDLAITYLLADFVCYLIWLTIPGPVLARGETSSTLR